MTENQDLRKIGKQAETVGKGKSVVNNSGVYPIKNQVVKYSWSGKRSDQMSTLEKTAYLRMNSGKETARDAFAALSNEMQSVGSRHYSPYLSSTTNQKEAAEFFGRTSFDQQWLNDNRYLLQYVTQLDLTDTVSTSGQKKWSDAQWAGYYYQKLNEAEQTTQAAESEWAQLREDMQRNFTQYKQLYGENPSYDTLMGYINMSNYPTLKKMDGVYENVEDLVRLNRPVNYTPETMTGVYAALLGGKDVSADGNYFEDAVQYTMKPLSQHVSVSPSVKANYAGWTQEQLDAKRSEIRSSGSRAQLSQFERDVYESTEHLDSVDSESYFRESYYDEAFLKKYAYLDEYIGQLTNREGKVEKPSASDPWWYGAAYEYHTIKQREEATAAAEQEWSKLKSRLTSNYDATDDAQTVLESIDWDKYPTLKKLRDGQQIDMNRPVYFSDEAILGVLKASGDGQATDNDDFDYALYRSEPKEEAVEEESQEAEDGENSSSSVYFQGPSAYGGKIEGYDDAEPEQVSDNSPDDAQEEYQPDFNAYFNGTAAYDGKIEGYDDAEPEQVSDNQSPEERAAARQEMMKQLLMDVFAPESSTPIMIEKAFYDQNGRPMTDAERYRSGILGELRSPEEMRSIVSGGMQDQALPEEEKSSIFDDTYNAIAARYSNPKTGKAYENMDELVANDPSLLLNILEYAETAPEQEREQHFTTDEVEHLRLMQQYRHDLEQQTIENMFRVYADENAVDEDRLNAALTYVIESGLTLNEKAALGLLDWDESMEVVAQRSQELVAERGNEFSRAMAIGMLGEDAPEVLVNITDAALSNVLAVETGIAGGTLKTPTAFYEGVRTIYAASRAPFFRRKLGDNYTLDEACSVDPLLRGLSEATDKAYAISDIAAPDMSNYGYGASFVRMIVEDTATQKVNSLLGAGLKPLWGNLMPGIDQAMQSDKRLIRVLGKMMDSATGMTPWMLQSMADSTREARELGVSESDAFSYGVYSAATSGVVEGVVGQMYDPLGEKVGGFLADRCKSGIKNLTLRRGVNLAKDLLIQAAGESAEEVAEMPLDKIGRSWFLGEELSFSGADVKQAAQQAGQAFVSSFFTSLFFGLSAGQETKTYTDSEILADRIIDGEVTAEELFEYEMVRQQADGAGVWDRFTDRETLVARQLREHNSPYSSQPESSERSLDEDETARNLGAQNSSHVEDSDLSGQLQEDMRRQIDDSAQGDTVENSAAVDDSDKESEAATNSDTEEYTDETAEESSTRDRNLTLKNPSVSDVEARRKKRADWQRGKRANYKVRDSVRIMQQNMQAMDEAAIQEAANEQVEQQIAEGALDHLTGEGAAPQVEIKRTELKVQQSEAKIAQIEESVAQIDAQKEAAIYTAVSNGISVDKGSARQLIHNFDEQKAAQQRELEKAQEKYAQQQAELELQIGALNAKIEQERQTLVRAAEAGVRKNLEKARKDANRAIEEGRAAIQKLGKKLVEQAAQEPQSDEAKSAIRQNENSVKEKTASVEPDENPQIIGGMDDDDPYAPFSAANQESAERVSQFDANREHHFRGTDIVPDLAGDLDDGFWTVNRNDYMLYEAVLGELRKRGCYVKADDVLQITHEQKADAPKDPVAEITDNALRTVARSQNGEYVLVKDTGKGDEQQDKPYMILRKPTNEEVLNFSSSVRTEADRVLEALDRRIDELTEEGIELEEQGIYGVDINQTKKRLEAVWKYRQMTAQGISSGEPRKLIDRLNKIADNENDQRVGVRELRDVLANVPSGGEEAFDFDKYVVGYYTNKRDAMSELTRIGVKVQEIAPFGKTIRRVSTDFINAIYQYGDIDEFLGKLLRDEIEISEFIDNNPALFGLEEKYLEESDYKVDLTRPYTSRLPSENSNYAAIDQNDTHTLVVAKKHVRLDPSDTGVIENVNRGIHSIDDAIRALDEVLISDMMSKGRRDAKRVIYTTIENGKMVNRTYQDFVDSDTGVPRMPTARELLGNSVRVTVNWVRSWKQANPNQAKGQIDPRTGKEIKIKYLPDEKLSFTIERNDSGNGYTERRIDVKQRNEISPRFRLGDTQRVESVVKEMSAADRFDALVLPSLRRAQADFRRIESSIGSNERSNGLQLRYFGNVCEAYYNSYLHGFQQMGERMDSSDLSDQDLATITQRAKEYEEAMAAWRYALDLVERQMQATSDYAMRKSGMTQLLETYENAFKKGGDADMPQQLQLASDMREALIGISRQRMKTWAESTNQTVESLTQERDRLTAALEEVISCRNSQTMLSHETPAELNNEPLAEAIIEQRAEIDQQIEALEEYGADKDSAEPEEVQAAAVTEEEPQSDVEEPAAESEAAQEEKEPAKSHVEVLADEYFSGFMNDEYTPPAKKEGKEAKPAAPVYDPDAPLEESTMPPVYESNEPPVYEPAAAPAEEASEEYIDPETGEVLPAVKEETREKPPVDMPAQELSFSTPVEDYAAQAGLVLEYEDAPEIDSIEAHDTVEKQADDAVRAYKSLTSRIDEMQEYLSAYSNAADAELIKENQRKYVAMRNKLKGIARDLTAKVANSSYISSKSVANIVWHCLDHGDVNWEEPAVRSAQIKTVREEQLASMRSKIQERMRAGETTALTVEDAAYILSDEEFDGVLKARHQIGYALHKRLRELSEERTGLLIKKDRLQQKMEREGESEGDWAEMGRIDEELNLIKSQLENGERAKRMFFDAGSHLTVEEILEGKDGGKLPLTMMNRVFAMLQQAEIDRKGSTNRMGILSNLDNPLRVVEYFTGEFAPVFNSVYIAPVLKGNARMATDKSRITDALEATGITAKNEEIAFKYIEGKISDEELKELVPNAAERDAITQGAAVYANVYDELFDRVNDALKRNGFEEIAHRKNYVHHMRDAQDGIAKVCSMLGIHISEDALPTQLAGKTEDMKPRRKFMSAAMERHSDETSYKLRRNTMAYVDAALRVIHHTDNITRLRQLEGISEKTENQRAVNAGLRQYGELSGGIKERKDGRYQAYSSFAEWISRYADGLAGKKTGKLDRAVESGIGRNALQVISGIKGLTGSSVTAYSTSVALSNVLPIATMASISPKQTMKALGESFDAFFKIKDWREFEAKSDFLTARFEGKGMSMSWLDDFKEKGYIWAEAIDRFAAHTAVRTFYDIGRSKGWTDQAAIEWADQMAWRMMASRNVGEGSNTMNTTVSSAILQFSREGINNIQFLMHDLPRYHGDDKKTWASLFGLFIANFLYNTLFNKNTGMEPITPTLDSIREWDGKKSLMQNLGNTVGNFAEAFNPTNLGTGGGVEDIPVVSAVSDLAESAGELDGDAFLTACLGFVPGGVSFERFFSGIGDMRRGYSMDDEGNIRYALHNDTFSVGSVWDAIAATLIGGSATIGGRGYKASGYQKMTKTMTEAFHSEMKGGASSTKAYNAVMGYTDQSGSRNASAMVLPDWANEQRDSDWMKAVIESGTDAYPKKAPDSMTIDGVKYTLTDEQKAAFDKAYRTTYRMYILDAMAEEGDLAAAADKAYRKAQSIFKNGLEE